MKTIRILIYTDIRVFNMAGRDRAGIDLQNFVKQKLAKIAEAGIKVVSRHFDLEQPDAPPAFIRLTHDLLFAHDVLWVFGFGNEDTRQSPEFAFDAEEVMLLCEWMKRGGVMVTGDHSQLGDLDNTVCAQGVSHDKFFARGSALGHRIPRARQLRVWKGPPTNCDVDPSDLEKSDTQNTLDKVGTGSDLDLEKDEFPQTLEGLSSPPHFLFTYDLGDDGRPTPITHFPDHQHEGRVLIPETFNEDWPQRPPDPKPEFVAFGRDKRFTAKERVYPLVVAYDGDHAGIGRIVADTSFHHYIDLNLRQIDKRDAAGPLPKTPLDEIAQYYANLAYWLAPKSLRDEIKRDLLFQSAIHLSVLETVGNGTARLGRAARAALKSEVGAANLYRIFVADGPSAEQHLTGRLLAFAVTGRGAPEGFEALDGDHLLGSVIEDYHRFFVANGLNPLNLLVDPTTPSVTSDGVQSGFLKQFPEAEGLLSRRAGVAAGDSSGNDEITQKENEMKQRTDKLTTSFLCGGPWHSTVRRSGSVIEEGDFDLTVDTNGNLQGSFKIKNGTAAPIEGGTCHNNHMVIRRRDGSPGVLVYEGDVVNDGEGDAHVNGGKRRKESDNFSAEGGAKQYGEAAKEAALVAGDDWDATKTTTFE